MMKAARRTISGESAGWCKGRWACLLKLPVISALLAIVYDLKNHIFQIYVGA